MTLRLLTLALLAAPALAQVDGLGYRLSPEASYVWFENDAGLTETLLYGGGVGLSFGELVELSGTYLIGDAETDLSQLSGAEADPALAAALAALPTRSVDVERYGAQVRFNLGRGAAVPFLTAGAGIVRFSPDGSDASRSLYLLGGAGLQLVGGDRYALSVQADAFGYRYNPGIAFLTAADLGTLGLGPDDLNQVQVLNPAVRAAVSVYLGGRRPGELSALDRTVRQAGGIGGLRLSVEPFLSQTEFDEVFDYSDQVFAGAELGAELGLVGLRAFYGRGVDGDDPTSAEEIQMVGGALRLRLSEGGGVVPFLSVGGGYLDVLEDYAATTDPDPAINRSQAESRPFALAGGGLELPIGQRLRVVGEVRALVMSTQDADAVAEPDDVFLSPSYRVGLALGFGGADARPILVEADDRDARDPAAFDDDPETAALRADLAAAQAELDALRSARAAALDGAIERAEALGDTAAVARLEAAQAEAVAPAAATGLDSLAVGPDGVARSLPTPIRTSRGERVVTIPLPETGELYVRYGEPGGVQIGPDGTPVAAAQTGFTAEEVREAVRLALQEAAASGDPDALDPAAIERRVEDRIADRLSLGRDGVSAGELAAIERRLDARIGEEMAEIRALLYQLDARRGPIVVTPGVGPGTPVAPTDTTAGRLVTRPEIGPAILPLASRSRGLYAVSPAAGVGFGRSGNVLAGLRAAVASGGRLTYVPELLVGVLGRRYVAVNLDATLPLAVDAVADYGTPYLRGGVGAVNVGASDDVPDTFDEEIDEGGTAFVLNLGLGATLEAGGGRLFVDFSTGNLGRYNRLTAGYRFPFGGRLD